MSVTAKQTYRAKVKLEVFYTGGAAALSPDGQHLACACGDEVKVVTLASGTVVHTLPGDSEPVTAVAYSAKGYRLYTASRSLLQRSWDVATGRSLRSWKGHLAPVVGLAADDSGALLASCSADRSVRVWDTTGGFCTHVFTGHKGVVFTVLFQPAQLTVMSGGDDGEVRVWDLVTKSCVHVLQGHLSAVTSLSLAMDGWTLVSGSRDRTARVWDLRSGAAVATVPVHEAVEGVLALPGGALFPAAVAKAGKKAVNFVTAGERGRLRAWRSDTGSCLYEQPEHPGGLPAGGELTWAALLPGGSGVVAATGDCRFQLFHPQKAGDEGGAPLALVRQLVGNNDEVTDIRFVGPLEAPTHLAVTTNSTAIRLFDTDALGCSLSLEGHSGIVLGMDVLEQPPAAASGAPHGTLLLTGSKDNTMRLWQLPGGRCLGIGEGHIASVSAVALSRRGPKFAVSGGADKLLKVWDLPGALLEGGGGDGPAAMRVTAAVAAHDKDINALAVAPNDAFVASASQDRTAKVWRLPALSLVATLRGHKRGVWDVAFSPVDQAVATASGDKTVRVWSLADGSCLRTLEGHTASALRCSFLSAGTQLLSSGADGLLKLWGVRTGECLSTFDEHEGKVWAMAVGAGESLVATGGADATVVLWHDYTAEDQAAAAEEEETIVLRQQDLANALHRGDYGGAAQLAFEMRQPGRLLAVVDSALASGDRSKGAAILDSLASGWAAEQLKAALEYCREWNTNSRVCHAAQALLTAILRRHSPRVLLAVPGVAEILEGLTVYTQNHFARVARLQRSAYLVDYTLASMDVLTPAAGDTPQGAAPDQLSDPPPEPATPPQVLDGEAENGAEQQPVSQPAEQFVSVGTPDKEQQKRDKKKRQSAAKKRRKSEAAASTGKKQKQASGVEA